jgi:hypothetical protein
VALYAISQLVGVEVGRSALGAVSPRLSLWNLTVGHTSEDTHSKGIMPTVKTTILLPEPLFQRAETVAHALQISRNQLVATAVSEFLKQYERKALVEAINQAFEDEPSTSEEKELIRGIRATQRKRLES